MPGPVTKKQVTIANGTSLSDEADLTGFQVVAIQMPAAWDAANLTFQARPGKKFATTTEKPEETLQNVYDDAGTEVSVTAAASRYIAVTGTKLDALLACGALKVRSGTSGVPVNQTANRVLTLVVQPIH